MGLPQRLLAADIEKARLEITALENKARVVQSLGSQGVPRYEGTSPQIRLMEICRALSKRCNEALKLEMQPEDKDWVAARQQMAMRLFVDA